ncbi:A24 family peptidase [Nocardiopsis tropica]|uniref:A24 family peptidase n=1 Tax=Tsukamurella strandjordii TaxID=147577 RepID=UPI0031DEACFD
MEWGLFGGFVAWCAALCWFDVRERRLPNALTVPAALAAIAVALVLALGGATATAALTGSLLWTGIYLVAFVGRGVGAGDVKLAPTLGAVLGGVAGVPAVIVALLGAQVLTLVWAAATRDRTVPHGPAMCVAALASYLAFR